MTAPGTPLEAPSSVVLPAHVNYRQHRLDF